MSALLAQLEAEYARANPGVAYYPNSIYVSKGSLWIGDPCYSKHSEDVAHVDAKNGYWQVSRVKNEDTVILEHVAAADNAAYYRDHKVDVDSGQIFIVDETLFPDAESEDPVKEAFYEAVSFNNDNGFAESGFVTGTGGDGTFTAEVWYNGDHKAVRIVLFGTLADDEEDD
ncbi:MAG: hypothetical protein ACYC8W_07700 [Candidatus Tyrphobacter sp.]